MKPSCTIYKAFEQAKEERDLLVEVETTQIKLKEELTKHGFQVTPPLFVDRARHIQQAGNPDEWTYIIWYQKDENGNTSLHCSVGFTQIGEQFDLRIPVTKCKKKKKGK